MDAHDDRQGAPLVAVEEREVAADEAVLVELRRRLDAARWLAPVDGMGWELGTSHDALREVAERWRDGFDWREHEAWLDQHRNLFAEVGGATMHALHARSAGAGALPLVLFHGWPSTVSEFRHVVEPLRNPAAHGGAAEDAFDVYLVSLPGFGFGGPTRRRGWGPYTMAEAVARLLRSLGVERYGVFGTDAGAYVATALASVDGDAVVGVHLQIGGITLGRQARLAPDLRDAPTEEERRAFEDLDRYDRTGSAYATLNGTKPESLAVALHDSPLGQLAWILEKFHEWTDRSLGDGPTGAVAVDDVLAIATTYWITGTAASAARFYADGGVELATRGLPNVSVPVGCAAFPADIVTPSRRWAEPSYPTLQHWTDMPRGGHFGALEVPDLLVEDLRTFFRPLR